MRWTTGRGRQAGTAWSASLLPSPDNRTLFTAQTAKRSALFKGEQKYEDRINKLKDEMYDLKKALEMLDKK